MQSPVASGQKDCTVFEIGTEKTWMGLLGVGVGLSCVLFMVAVTLKVEVGVSTMCYWSEQCSSSSQSDLGFLVPATNSIGIVLVFKQF